MVAETSPGNNISNGKCDRAENRTPVICACTRQIAGVLTDGRPN